MQNSTAETISSEQTGVEGSFAAGKNSTAARVHNLKKQGALDGAASTSAAAGFHGSVAKSARENGDSAVICNISEQSWLLNRTFGTFAIAACEPGEDFALTPVSGRMGMIDLGDKHKIDVTITASQLATDLAREINSDGGEGSNFGVFVCDGSSPTDEELLEAQDRLDLFYKRLVASADQQWARTHNVVLISDLERRAARALKLEKEWCYEGQQRVECPACGEKLKPGVAVCRVCHAVLDKEKAAQYGLGKTEGAAAQSATHGK